MKYAENCRTLKEESVVKSATLKGWFFRLFQAKTAFYNFGPAILYDIRLVRIGRP